MMKTNILGVIALCSLTVFSSHALELKIIGNKSNDNATKFLNQIEKELPDSVKKELPEVIEVEFKSLNKVGRQSLDEKVDDRSVLARVNRFNLGTPRLELDTVLLAEMEKPERKINATHSTNHLLVKATIAHEIFHLYDFEKKFSHTSDFLNIAGYISKGLLVKKRTNLNQANARTPDRYELKSSEESAAVNFEFFLYDPEFKCRRPTFYDYYSRRLGMIPSATVGCESNTKITVFSQTLDQVSTLVRELDPKRLYEIHYLFAGKGEATMSRFGHSMFRIVMCAPGRAVGPECLSDYAHHIIVSFRANIQDVTMSYMKGINGEYNSQLFFLNLREVIAEYTQGEFREMHSVPLKLTDVEKRRFLERSSELYWSYKGRYYFFTNNCATEAMNLLRVAMNEKIDVQDKDILTPIGLYKYLEKKGITNTAVYTDMKKAEQKGYYFPAVSDKIAASLKLFGFPGVKFEKFVEENDAKKRKIAYERVLTETKDRLKVAANALRVEDLILRSLELKFTKTMGAKLFGSDPDPRLVDTNLGGKVKELQALYGELAAENFVKPGYGVPLKADFEEIPMYKVREVADKIKSYSGDLQEIAKDFFPDEVNEIKETMENRIMILNVISEAK